MLSLLFIIFASIVLLLAFYEIRTRKWLATAICIEDPTQHIPYQSPLVFWAKFIKRFVLTKDTQNNSVMEDKAITDYKKRGYKAFQQVFLWFRFVRIWDPEQIKRILQTERSTYPKASGFMEGTDFGRLTGKSILFAEGDVWKKQKQSLGGAFHFEKLKLLQERVMVDRAQALIRIWEPLAGSVIEVHPWLTKLTLEVIGLAGFGHDFGALEGRHSKEVEAYNTILDAVMNPLRNIPGYKSLPIKDNRVVREAFELFEKLILDVIAQKRELLKNSESQQPNDLLDMLIAAREKDAMTEHELMQNVEVFFLAGHETSSGALAMTLHCLAEHPEIQEKLRQEVDRVLPLPSSVPDHNSIKEMRYLNCVINEVLRLYPPAASLVRVVEEDTELSGYLIHKGDMVAIPTYSVHRMKEYWGEDALEFRPERFLAKNEDGHQIDPHESVAGDSDSSSSSSSSAAHERHPYAYIPFGAGPRVCVGNNFALLEIKTVLSMLLRRFTFRTAPGSPVPFELARSITLKPRDDSRLIFELRQQ